MKGIIREINLFSGLQLHRWDCHRIPHHFRYKQRKAARHESLAPAIVFFLCIGSNGRKKLVIGDVYLIDILVNASLVFNLQFNISTGSQRMIDENHLVIPAKRKVLSIGFNFTDFQSRVQKEQKLIHFYLFLVPDAHPAGCREFFSPGTIGDVVGKHA